MIRFECPCCSARIRVPDEYAGKCGKCPTCRERVRVPQLPSDQNDSLRLEPLDLPTESVSEMAGNVNENVSPPSVARPTALVVLMILTGVHILLNAALFVISAATENRLGLFGGFVSCGFYIAILIGLINMQEWARVMLIFLCYVGIVFSLFLLSPLEIITLIFAHRRSVREATKGKSMAQAYTYHENVQTRKEQA